MCSIDDNSDGIFLPTSQHFSDMCTVGKFGVVFLFLSVSSFLFLLRPVSVQVISPWFDVDFLCANRP